MLRTHTCGELRAKDAQQEVTLAGWIHSIREHGNVTFLDLRDRYGITQIVTENFTAPRESVIQVKGVVEVKPEANKSLKTGEIEIKATKVKILSKADTIPIDDNATEEARLKYRYLDLRSREMQENLRIRHEIIKIAREHFYEKGFLELETPILAKSTPEGARDYLVPSRVHKGKFYALPQSPQLFKQLFMIAGMDKYFQVARCFRDEDLRKDRQPEFTQLDLEMSFVEAEDIIEINEQLVNKLWKNFFNQEVKEIPHYSYEEVMEKYGTDRPDLRFDLQLNDLTEIAKQSDFKIFQGAEKIYALVAPAILSRKKIDKLTKHAQTHGAKGLAYVQVENKELEGGVSKFLTNIQDDLLSLTDKDATLLFVADEKLAAQTAIGQVRLKLAEMFDLQSDDHKFCWVRSFPMFEYNEEQERYTSMHHPFTKPEIESIEELTDDKIPTMLSDAYDLVLNGSEIAGGSIRIHDPKMQEAVFELLGISKEEAQERFGFFTEALSYGTPPHGGIAWGLDRLATIITGNESIRSVIAFPKTKNAEDLMMKAPSMVDQPQLQDLGISLTDKE